jgi:hypothetical protein
VRSPAARRTGIAISTALAVVFAWLTFVFIAAALSTDGTWADVVGVWVCVIGAVGFTALALGGTR